MTPTITGKTSLRYASLQRHGWMDWVCHVVWGAMARSISLHKHRSIFNGSMKIQTRKGNCYRIEGAISVPLFVLLLSSLLPHSWMITGKL